MKRENLERVEESAAPKEIGQNCQSGGLQVITLTDANYGNEVKIRADHITAITIVSETTYREGTIPDGTFRRTLLYTLGGNQLAVREAPDDIWRMIANEK